jgi:hypothetical protein
MCPPKLHRGHEGSRTEYSMENAYTGLRKKSLQESLLVGSAVAGIGSPGPQEPSSVAS